MHCSFYNRNGRTIDFCYQKHGHPSFNKNKPLVNASTSQSFDFSHPHGATEDTSSASNHATISQKKYNQPVSLLWKVNLLPSASSTYPIPQIIFQLLL